MTRIDETRGNITVEEGHLFVNGRNIDRQTHNHDMVTENAPQQILEILSGHVATHLESTQPQHKIRQLSRDTSIPILENTPRPAPKDHN